MCTVTFIPFNEKYLITANRDEKNTRKPAIAPAVYKSRGRKLIYPKDGDAGGTWIVAHENGNAAVLLNGAFENHVSIPLYRKSRGKILLDIIARDGPLEHFCRIDLDRIEPFTLVLFEKDKLYECRWDGRNKYYRQQVTSRPHIWSSVTLYDEKAINIRKQRFEVFLNNKPHPTWEEILVFHQSTGDDDSGNGLVINRENMYSTQSITSLLLTAEGGNMKYLDLKNETVHETGLEFRQLVRNDMI